MSERILKKFSRRENFPWVKCRCNASLVDPLFSKYRTPLCRRCTLFIFIQRIGDLVTKVINKIISKDTVNKSQKIEICTCVGSLLRPSLQQRSDKGL